MDGCTCLYRVVGFVFIFFLISGCGIETQIPLVGFGGTGDGGGIDVQPTRDVALSFLGTPQKVQAGGFIVPIFPEAVVSHGDKTSQLSLTGHGIMKRRVLLFDVDVYLIASYLTKPHKFSGNEPLNAVFESPVEINFLTMLRTLDGEQIEGAFRDALKTNQLDADDMYFDPIYGELQRGAKNGEQVIFLSLMDDLDTERLLIIRDSGEKLDTEGPTLGYLLWHVWFGKTASAESARVKDQLTGRQKTMFAPRRLLASPLAPEGFVPY